MIELRQYQKEAIEAVDALPDGSRTIVALATGLGKTVVAANFATNGRILWLSHRDELVRQPEKYFAERGLSYGIEKAEETSNGEQVVSASVPSLCKDKRLHRFSPDAFDLIVVDEAQHAAAKTYRKILTYFHPRKLVGLTATPKRGDGVRLSDEFDTICFARDLKWGIQNHYLADISCLRVYGDFSLKDVAMTDGDYALGDMTDAMKHSENAKIVAKAYHDECIPRNLPTLIYCPTIEICGEVYQEIQKVLSLDLAKTVAVLTGTTDSDVRADILKKYQAGEIQCIINCMILTEGTDLPRTACILNDRPTANDTLYQQIIGRGTRLSDGKDKCLVIDIVNDDWKDKRICTAPTLFGISPERLDEKALRRISDGETSLLEIADDAINAESPLLAEEILKKLVLRKEKVDLFAEAEETEIRSALSSGGVSYLAKTTEKKLNTVDVPEFGDLIVHETPYEDRMYFIRGGFYGKIYFSKPDILNQVVMEVEGILPTDCVSDSIPLPQAVEFATDLLYARCDSAAYLWSKKARKWQMRESTPKQQGFIGRLYGEMLPRGSETKKQMESLSMVQAGDLIDRKLTLDKYHEKAKDTEKALTDAQKKRRGKILDKWETKKREELAVQEKEKEYKKKRWEQYWNSRDSLHAQAELARKRLMGEESRKSAAQESIRRRLESGEGEDRTFRLSYGYFQQSDLRHKVSDKQRDFISSLVHSLRRKNIVFLHENALTSCNMPQTGLIIDTLLTLDREAHVPLDRGVSLVYDARQLSGAVSDIVSAGQKSNITLSEFCYTKEALEQKIREEKNAKKTETVESSPSEKEEVKTKKKMDSPSANEAGVSDLANESGTGQADKRNLLPKGSYAVYTDGGCEVNPGGKGGAACVIVDSDENVARKCSEGYFATTNNRMEMRAVLLALEQVESGSEIHLYSDSLYVLNGISGTWQRKKNTDLWLRLDHALKQHDVELAWVRGHNGDKYNEICDSMCTEAMQHPTLTDRGYHADAPKSDNSLKRKQKQTSDAVLPAALSHEPKTLPKDQFAAKHQINSKCAAGILHFRNTKKKFKDFAALKTFGQDFWSRKKIDFMLQDDPNGEDLLQYLEQVFGEGSPDIIKAVRWYKRGLSADDAAHKVKVDNEIAANAMQ